MTANLHQRVPSDDVLTDWLRDNDHGDITQDWRDYQRQNEDISLYRYLLGWHSELWYQRQGRRVVPASEFEHMDA